MKKIFWLFFAFIVIAAAFWLLAGHPIDSDEGAVLNMAWQLWQGKVLYLDFFDFLPPGAAYLLYFLWHLTGPTYLSAKLFSLFLALLSLFGVFLITQKLSGKKWAAVIATLLWLIALRYYPIINHNTYSSYLAVWLLYFLLSFDKPRRLMVYAFWGALNGLIAWILYTKGLVLLGLSFLILWRPINWHKQNLLAAALFLGGFMVSLAVFFWPWIWSDNLKAVYENLLAGPWQNHYLLVNLKDEKVILAAIAVSLAMLVWAAWTKNKKNLILSLFQSALFLGSFNNPDWPHFMINSFPFWIFLALIINRLCFQFFPAAALLVALWSVSGSLLGQPSLNNIFSLDLAGKSPLADLPLEIKQAAFIYAGPFLPGLYFELKKPNPFVYAHNLTLCDQACLSKTLTIFQEAGPEFALLDYQMVKKWRYDENNLFESHIKNHYRLCRPLGDLLIYARDRCPR